MQMETAFLGDCAMDFGRWPEHRADGEIIRSVSSTCPNFDASVSCQGRKRTLGFVHETGTAEAKYAT